MHVKAVSLTCASLLTAQSRAALITFAPLAQHCIVNMQMDFLKADRLERTAACTEKIR